MADILKDNGQLDGLENDEVREVVDLDGEPFEIIADLEHEGAVYLALIPFMENIDDFEKSEEEIEFIILREEEENGEPVLATVDNQELEEKLGKMFLELFAS